MKVRILNIINQYKTLDYLLIISALLLFYPSLLWLGKVFFGLYDYFNLVLLAIIIFLIGNKYNWKKPEKAHINYQFKLIPFIISILTIPLWLIATYKWDIHIISAISTLIFVYGLLGLFIRFDSWIKASIPFGLILMTLPFGNIIDVYAGFPLRMFSVDIISGIFNVLGIDNISSSTIITVDNSATQIDFSCSGIKGIWASLIFYFTLTWIDNIKIGLYWFINLILLLLFVISANIIRIFLIVSLISIFNMEEFAKSIHSSLGIIGFTFSCGLSYFITKTTFFKKEITHLDPIGKLLKSLQVINIIRFKEHNWSKITLILSLILSSFIQPAKTILKTPERIIKLPDEWKTKTLELTTDEIQYFKEQQSQAIKTTFETEGLSGSLLFVTSNGWRGHHNPEFCIRAGGNTINKLETVLINKDLPIKWMKINNQSSACYWFQSPSFVTDDFGTRVWAEVKNEEKNWQLVFVVFNTFQEIKNKNVQYFIEQLNQELDVQSIINIKQINHD